MQDVLIWGKARAETKVKAKRIRRKPPKDVRLAIATGFCVLSQICNVVYALFYHFDTNAMQRDVGGDIIIAPIWAFVILDILAKSTWIQVFGPYINLVWKYTGTYIDALRVKFKKTTFSAIMWMYGINMVILVVLSKISTGYFL